MEEKNTQINITIFDYLSKISHWNPKVLKDLTGFNKDYKLGYTPEYVRLCIIGLITFISCLVIFAETFLSHFFKDKHHNELEQLGLLRTDFEQFVAALLKPQLPINELYSKL